MKKKILTISSCLALLVSCSTQKDKFVNRTFHSTTAWFNTLFNAEEAMDKKLSELKLEYKDNYSEILPVDPLPPIVESEYDADEFASTFKNNNNKDNNKPSATGFDLVEQKALKAIEKHSMQIKGKERNKMMTRAYLILGKARYNKGKGFEALDALNYLKNNFPYHKKYTPQAELYIALANIQTGNIFEGERVLEKLYKDDGVKKRIYEDISKNYAQNLIRTNDFEQAIEVLDDAIRTSKNKQRKARYYYIQGQLYSLLGMQQEAGEAFTKVYKMKPGFEMEVKSQIAIAENFDPKINNYTNYKNHILDISKKGNYVSRKNEFFYAIGSMALKDNKIDEAREYLKKSFEGQPSDPYIRGKAYETYANLEFDAGNYVHASAYYDSALVVAPYEKDKNRITERNTSLKVLMEKYYLVKKNDSIIRLASMSPLEKEMYFKEFINKLKIEDEKKQREAEIEMTTFQTQSKGGSFNSSFEQQGNTFYFYNNSQKSFGQTEFKRVWGNVKLTDNWRSSAGATQSIEDREAEMLGKVDTQNPRRYDIDFYLEQLPQKRSEIEKLKIERDTTELALGIGYYEMFNHSKNAIETLEHLISTPPKEPSTTAQAYYQLYRIYNKIENVAKADEYKNLILSKFPNSIYAEYILNPEFDFTTPTTKEALALYEETYALYKDKKYDLVKKNTADAIVKYPTEVIIAKFSLLNALAIGASEDKEKFIHALELVTIAYPKTDEATKAQEILDLLTGKNKKQGEPQEGKQAGKKEVAPAETQDTATMDKDLQEANASKVPTSNINSNENSAPVNQAPVNNEVKTPKVKPTINNNSQEARLK